MLVALLPRSLIERHPALVRLPNVAVVLFALAVFFMVARRRHLPLRLPLELMASSPILLLYSFVSRGYLLGTTLATLSIVALSSEWDVCAGVLLALGSACVPTFAFVAPGLVLVILVIASPIRRGRRRSLVFGGVFAATVIPFYAGKAHELLGARYSFTAVIPVQGFLKDLFACLSSHAAISMALILFVAIGVFAARSGPHKRLALALVSAVLSYVAVAIASKMSRGMSLPFPRNGVFVPLMVWFALLMLAWSGPRVFRVCASGLASVNAVLVMLMALRSFVLAPRDLHGFPYFAALAPTPTLSALASPPARMEACWAAVPVAQMYAGSMHIPLQEAKELDGPCLVGTDPGPPTTRVRIVNFDGQAGLICF